MQKEVIQLREELKKEKEEKLRTMEELAEMKNNVIVSERDASESKSKIDALQKELEKAKQSERKMLESLVSQTKVLAETKESLEEAKLEISSLKDNIKSLEKSKPLSGRSSKNLKKKNGPLEDDEITMLKNNLKLAMEAEEKSKIAMDDLASVLKEVMTEANGTKERLSITLSELEELRAESESLKSLLKATEEKYQLTLEESQRLESKIEVSVAAWNAKETNAEAPKIIVASTSADNSHEVRSSLETKSSRQPIVEGDGIDKINGMSSYNNMTKSLDSMAPNFKGSSI